MPSLHVGAFSTVAHVVLCVSNSSLEPLALISLFLRLSGNFCEVKPLLLNSLPYFLLNKIIDNSFELPDIACTSPIEAQIDHKTIR